MDGISVCRQWLKESSDDLRRRAETVQCSYDLLQNKTTSYASALRVHAARLMEASKVMALEVTDHEWDPKQ